jgi:hypothetical protein
MTKLFRKIVIPVFCLICGFYLKQELVNLYNLDVSLLVDYLLVYIPATISNSIISFILDYTKLLSYMSSGNGDNASNIGEINAGNVTGDNSNNTGNDTGDNSNNTGNDTGDNSNNTGKSNDTGNSVHGDGNNSDNDGNNSDNSSTPDLEDDSSDVILQDLRDAKEEHDEVMDDPEATTGDKLRADIRLQKAMITTLDSRLEADPDNDTAKAMVIACRLLLADLEDQLDDLDSDDE